MVRPDPVSGPDARRAAVEELSRPEYRHHDSPSLLERFGRWLAGLFHHDVPGFSGGGSHAVLIILVVLLALVIVFAARAGLPHRRRRAEQTAAVDPLAPVDSREHRRLAERYTAEGRHAEALREWLRAAVATIEERGVLPPRPGRTGATTALETRTVLPSAAADLAAAVRAFDEVWFGGRAAVAQDVAPARAAADEVRSARPRGGSDADVPAGLAAPW